jgi:hypothetical protein
MVGLPKSKEAETLVKEDVRHWRTFDFSAASAFTFTTHAAPHFQVLVKTEDRRQA